MAKNHLTQHLFQHQTQTPSMSTSYAYTVDEDGGTKGSPTPPQMSLPSEEDLEDDHICPVCEGECTCAPAPLITSPSGYTTPPVVARVTEPVPSGSKHPSLKIKLTLPPSLVSGRSSASNNNNGKLSASFKKKSKNRVETTSGGENVGGQEGIGSPFSAPGQPLVHLNADGSFPKKRGRPTKAVAAARKAAQNQGLASESISSGSGNNVRNVDVMRQDPTHANAYTRKPVTQVKKMKKLAGAAAASRAAAQARRFANGGIAPIKPSAVRKRPSQSTVNLSGSSSELSDIDLQDEEDPHSIQYPTFIPAVSSSSSNSSDSEVSLDSSDSISEPEQDVKKVQEKEKSPREKLRMELGLATGGGEGSNHRKWAHRNNWEIRPRKNSVSVEGTSDDDNDSNEETEEEEGDADGEADGDADIRDEDEFAPGVRRRLMRYAGVATGWTDDDEESSFDAELFFAHLSSSSESGSDDEDDQMGDAEVGFGDDDADGQDEDELDFGTLERQLGLGLESDALTLSEIAAAGFLAPFTELDRDQNLPLSHGWDSMLGNNLRNISDTVDFALNTSNATGLTIDMSSIPGLAEADIMMATSEEEEAVAMFDINEDPFSPSHQDADLDDEDGVEIFEESDNGETTEDEYVDVDGVQTPRNLVLLRFPASLGGIDPKSTVNSLNPRGRLPAVMNGRSAPTDNTVGGKSTSMTKGAHGKKAALSTPDNKEGEKSRSNRAPPRVPIMGSFARELLDKTKRVVITKPGNTLSGGLPPSPFPAIRRIRRGSSIRSSSDRGSNRSRTSSFLATRSPYQALVSGDFDSGDADDLPPAEPIRLDDVLDTAFLEPEPPCSQVPDSAASETGDNESDSELNKHLESLRRWDCIPIDTFRKARSAGTAADLVGDKAAGSPLPRAPRPADGFSYGSAAGGMLRGSPFSATLWDSDSSAAIKPVPKQQKGKGRSGRLSVIISPVILPVRDGDRTPMNEHQQQAYLGYTGAHKTSHAYNHAQSTKSRKELRKEKKRNRKFFGSPAQNMRRNHFPNSKNRSTSSMQRTSFFSSSVPPLSI